MPSLRHEVPILLFQDEPEAVPKLLHDALGVAIPQNPALAVLAAMAHVNDPGGIEVGVAALEMARRLDAARATLYTDLVLFAATPETLKLLESTMNLSNDEYQSAFVKKFVAQGVEQGVAQGIQQGVAQGIQQGVAQGIQQGVAQGIQQGVAQGIQQGVAQGRAAAVLQVLETRGIVVGEDVRARVEGCLDLAILERWLARAVTASSAGDVVKD